MRVETGTPIDFIQVNTLVGPSGDFTDEARATYTRQFERFMAELL